MKREELRELLPDVSEEQLDAVFKAYGKELNPAKAATKAAEEKVADLTSQLEKVQADKATLTASLEEAQKKVEAGMTAEELLAKSQKEAKDREHDFLLKSNAVDAKSLFVEAGCFQDEEIASLVDQVVCEDVDMTLKKAQAIIDVVKRHGSDVEKNVKDEILKGNPKSKGSEGSAVMTKKEFMALPYKEQLQLKADNPNIISELKKE